jgi:ribosomal protein S18 acetylase RimI-like enzyme
MIRPAAILRRLTAADKPLLEDFFCALVASGSVGMFHPHPFDATTAARICGHAASDPTACDEYHAVIEDDRIVAYGMLRGWSEGYAVPSLGIAVLPECRRRGLAQRLMDHLHRVAADRGATAVRLKVYRTNASAIRLYETLGYRLSGFSETELLGHFPLPSSSPV